MHIVGPLDVRTRATPKTGRVDSRREIPLDTADFDVAPTYTHKKEPEFARRLGVPVCLFGIGFYRRRDETDGAVRWPRGKCDKWAWGFRC